MTDFLVQWMSKCCVLMETQEMKEKRERRRTLLEGADFTRKKHTFGFDLGSSESVRVKLDNDETEIQWHVVPQTKGSNAGAIKLEDIASAGSKAPKSLTLMSTTGDLLLEVESEDVQTRDEWVTAVNEAIPIRTDAELALKGGPSTLSGRALKQAYFVKKGMELSNKKNEAEERKKKYLSDSGGLKFTALAMASRP